jgi:hypothetical protein
MNFEVFFMSKQVLVSLDAALRGFVERAADRESRTVAGQIRHYIVEAMRHAGDTTAGSDPWPSSLAAVSRDNFLEIKAVVKAMEAERDELVAAEKTNRFDLLPHEEVRLQYLLEMIKCLQSHITGIERLTVGNNHSRTTRLDLLTRRHLSRIGDRLGVWAAAEDESAACAALTAMTGRAKHDPACRPKPGRYRK